MTAAECYRILGLTSGADMDRVKGAYRALAKKLHPDVSGSVHTGGEFQRIRAAYETLLAREKLRSPGMVGRSTSRRSAGPGTQRASQPDMGRRASAAAATRPERTPPVDVSDSGRRAVEGRTTALRLLAVRSLERSGKRSAYGYLRRVLYDSEEKVVLAAVRAIGTLGVEQSAGELAALFARSGARVKGAILSVAERMELRGPMLSLAVAGMEDGDESIRRAALRLYTKYKRIE